MRLGMVLTMATLALGCSKQERGGDGLRPLPRPRVDPLAVSATIAAVTLADDCGHAAAPAQLRRVAATAPAGDMAAGACAPGANCTWRRACRQSTMQLTLTSGERGETTEVGIVRVELIEKDSGIKLGLLVPREPRMWTENGYQPWDQRLAPRQSLQVMFDLSAPDWGPVGGIFQAQGKTFRLAVTISVNGVESTIEKTVHSPDIMIEPPVVT